MPSKNDLSGLKTRPAKTILPANDGQGRGDRPGPITGNKPVGRPKAAKGKKRAHKVTLSLDDAEAAKLQEKCAGGLIKEATLIYDHLIKTGFFK